MQWLWTVLSPIFWLCSILLNPWVVASLLGAITTAGVAFRRLRLKPPKQLSHSKPSAVAVVTSQQEVIKGILQVFPIHPSNGWALTGVANSVNVFSRVWDVLSSPLAPNGSSWKVLASLVILECPPELALSRSINHTDLPLWVKGLSLPGAQVVRTTPERDGDLIRLTFSKKDSTPSTKAVWPLDVILPLIKSAIATVNSYLEREVPCPTEPSMELLNRFWYSKPGLHYVHSVPQESSSLPYHWSSLLFTGVRDCTNICLATLVMLPRQHQQDHVTTLITNQLCALKQHIVFKNFKVYPSSHRTSRPPPLVDSQAPPNRSATTHHSRPRATPPLRESLAMSRRNGTEPSAVSTTTRSTQPSQPISSSVRETPSLATPSPPPPPPPRDSGDIMYLEMAKEKADKLISYAQATEGDGWLAMGTKNNVRVMKLPPRERGSPLNCVKGTGLVNAPPTFVMHFLKDFTYTVQLDDMLKEVRIIHVISPAVQIVHMLYKGVWPTAPRDFGVLNISGERDSQTWLSAAISVEDSRIPNEKGYVRGHLEVGGYVIRAVPGNPDVSEVTYVAQVDLKGSIPSMVTNKIADSQPQCVSKLRGIVEPLFARLSASPQALTEYKEKFKIAVIVEEEQEVDLTPPTNAPAVGESLPVQNGVLSQQNLGDYNTRVGDGPQALSHRGGSVQSRPQTSLQRGESVQSHSQTSLQRGESVQSHPQSLSHRGSAQSDSQLLVQRGGSFQSDPHPQLQRGDSVQSDSQTLLQRGRSVQISSRSLAPLWRDGSVQSGNSMSSQSLVVMGTVSEDSLKFQSPRLGDNVVPNPCLVQGHETGSPPREQTDDFLETFTPEEIPSDSEAICCSEGGGPSEAGGGVGVISLVQERPKVNRTHSSRGGGVPRDGHASSESGDSRGVGGSGGSSDGVESGDSRGSNVFVYSPSPRLELKLPQYPRPRSGSDGVSSEDSYSQRNWASQSLTIETLSYPRQGSGGLDFRTMANQTAAKVLEEVFHVSSIDLNDPATFVDQSGGWKFSGFEKDVLMLIKKQPDSPFNCFIGKGVIDLPPQSVYDSIRNPQLRFTYDNMLKELHIVKQVEEGLYILHLLHETTQCFMKQSRDFCLLVSERSEPNKKLLIGTSIEVPECPPDPNIHRGKVLCSGWVVEPYRSEGKLQTELTYLLQVDMGGIPSTLVNFISQRQPLAVAYLRDYLISTSLDLSHKEDKDTTL